MPTPTAKNYKIVGRGDSALLIVGQHVRLPLAEFRFTYARSSGPGGQNVNKVNTKAILRWDPAESTLPVEIRRRLVASIPSRLTTEGVLVLSSGRFRSQKKNESDCVQRVAEMIQSVLVPPKIRRKTRPSKGSVERRLKQKRAQSQSKQQRRQRNWDD